jgi:hypothetical protein
MTRYPEIEIEAPRQRPSPPSDHPCLRLVLTTSLQPLHAVIIFGATHTNIDENAVLRLRICGHAACRAAFTICVSCDRGQRYCSPEYRSEVRRRQRHEANRRYQQSELGRESHRRCQQRYRERASQPPVIDQGVAPITSAAHPQPPTVCQCAICGRRHSLWIDPFPTIPRQWRRGWRSKKYVFR